MTNRTTKSIIVKGDIDAIFDLWAEFENIPNFMHPIISVKDGGDGKTFWRAEGPLGVTIEWQAETTCMEKNKRIAWKSIGGDIKTTGQVTFNVLPKSQVEVTATMQYTPKAGLAGRFFDSWLSDPDKIVDACLRDFKIYAERHIPQRDYLERGAAPEKTDQVGLGPRDF